MAENDADIEQEPQAYRPVTFCRDGQQAEQFRDILLDHDIDAVLADEDDEVWSAGGEGVPVLVAPNSVEEAGEILGEIELLEEMDSAASDCDDDDVDDEQLTANMQPLAEDAYSLGADSPVEPIEPDQED